VLIDMTDITRILCPVDLSEPSRHALEHAAALARWYTAQLTVLHVYSAPPPQVVVSGLPGGVPLLPRIEPDEVIPQVRQFCESARRPADVPLEILVLEGYPARTITQQAQTIRADLLVMGTHGRGGFDRLFLGSVTEKVVRSTDVPVLTVPPHSRAPAAGLYNTIVCPVDFSDASTRALEYALSLAKDADARLVLLHVVEPFPEQLQAASIAHLERDDRVRLVEETTRLLAQAVPEQARAWCKPEIHVAFGKASREIVRVAADCSADLIVLGVHGRGAIDRWIFGSTTPRVIRESASPVLTVRA
jgi:nucleotide-binding universal stress UspA family protein